MVFSMAQLHTYMLGGCKIQVSGSIGKVITGFFELFGSALTWDDMIRVDISPYVVYKSRLIFIKISMERKHFSDISMGTETAGINGGIFGGTKVSSKLKIKNGINCSLE